jgi:hypothetical protein
MKIKRTTILILGLFILAGLTILLIELHERFSSSIQKVVQQQSAASSSDSIPPAPPPLAPVSPNSQKRIASQPPIPASFAIGDQLLYDEKLSFEDNLQRLKEFCISHGNDPQIQQLLDRFVKALFEHAKGQFPAVKYALDHPDGPAIYRNIVLDCLIVADGPISDKTDLVWGIAADKSEPIETRRLATHLTLQFTDGKSRPDEFLSLLNDSDSDIVILALKTASLQMDDRSYNFTKTSLLTSTDINVRIAAVDAIGSSTIANKQSELLSIINEQPTSKATIFSDSSLLKRRAISHLEVSDPQNRDLIEHIALDATEDPSVRADAIGRFTPKDFPASMTVLLNLFQTLNSDDAILLASIEDNLLTTPTPNILQAIRTKAEGLSDPQLRNFMIKQLEKTTNK